MARCKQIARSAGPSRVPRLIPVITQSPSTASSVAPVPSPVAAPPAPAPVQETREHGQASHLASRWLKFDSVHEQFPAEYLSPEWFEMVHSENVLHTWLKETEEKLARLEDSDTFVEQYGKLSLLAIEIQSHMRLKDPAHRALFKDYVLYMEAYAALLGSVNRDKARGRKCATKKKK